MKLDEDVKMISSETPLLISKACELFIIELAYRGWIHTLENNRRTLHRTDIAQAISHNDFYDFLLDIVEESCKNKLLYSAHSYSKNPSLPIMSLFDSYQLNMSQGQDIIKQNIINEINNFDNNKECEINDTLNKNKNKNIIKNDEEKANNIKDYNLNQSNIFPSFINNNSRQNSNLNMFYNNK